MDASILFVVIGLFLVALTVWKGVKMVPQQQAWIVEKMGGRILVPPTEIPGTGRFATIMDPQGIVFNVISPVDKEKQVN